jgi:hypothetical protein
MKALEIIEPNETWEIVDPSKLTTFMECPRRYFYRYIMGWKSDYPSNDLVFGSAWHLAVEHLLRQGYNSDSLMEAKYLFLTYYRNHFTEDSDELYVPKSPQDAFEALDLYFERFKDDHQRYSVEHTEVGGVVLINDQDLMHFKMDVIFRDLMTGLYIVCDHKTSKRKQRNWATSWNLSPQLLTYLHAIYCLYSPEEVDRAQVRGSFFYKAQPHSFEEAFIHKEAGQMQAWLEDTEYWYGALRHSMLELEECSDTDTIMQCFPRNGTACNQWGGCIYADVCDAWPNPLAKVGKFIPSGFNVEFWDPRENPTIRERVDLTGEGEEIDEPSTQSLEGDF